MPKNPAAILFFSLLLASLALAETATIERIEMKRDRGWDYLDIYTTGWSEAKGLLLENRLYLDFPNARLSGKTKIFRRISKRIQSISIIQKNQNTVRVIISLKKDIDYDVVNVFGRNKSVIEIGDRLGNINRFQFAWESRYIKKKGAPLKPVKFIPATAGSLHGKTIILDPGHGGDDPGAFSLSGVPEKTLTLQTAQRAAKRLRQAGAAVYLTRNEDRRCNLKEVAEFANRIRADIFISIHYNSIYKSDISGTETYYYNPVSRKFAEIMHENIIRGIKRKDHGLRRTPFYVVKNAEMPSVLLEPIYLTSPEESWLAGSPSFQEELAEDIVKGVIEYFRSKSG